MEKTRVIPMLTALTEVVCDFLVSLETLKTFVNFSFLGNILFCDEPDSQTVTLFFFLTFSKTMKNGAGKQYCNKK